MLEIILYTDVKISAWLCWCYLVVPLTTTGFRQSYWWSACSVSQVENISSPENIWANRPGDVEMMTGGWSGLLCSVSCKSVRLVSTDPPSQHRCSSQLRQWWAALNNWDSQLSYAVKTHPGIYIHSRGLCNKMCFRCVFMEYIMDGNIVFISTLLGFRSLWEYY